MSSDAFREREGTFYPPKGNKSSRNVKPLMQASVPRALFFSVRTKNKKINLEAFHFGVFYVSKLRM